MQSAPIIPLDSPILRRNEDIFSPPNGRLRSFTSADVKDRRDLFDENSSTGRERARSFSSQEESTGSKVQKSKKWNLFGRKKKHPEENLNHKFNGNPFGASEGGDQFNVHVNPELNGMEKLRISDERDVKGVSLCDIQTEFNIDFNDKDGDMAIGTLIVRDNSIEILKMSFNTYKKKPYLSLELKKIFKHRYAEDNSRVMLHYKWPEGSEGKSTRKAVFQDGCEIITVRTHQEADKFKFAIRVAIERALERKRAQGSA